MNDISDVIFDKIKNFEWTISSDGFDYDIRESKIGCSGQQNIGDKDGSLCEIRDRTQDNKHSHEFEEANVGIKPDQRSGLEIGT